jgi:hypothetical protein
MDTAIRRLMAATRALVACTLDAKGECGHVEDARDALAALERVMAGSVEPRTPEPEPEPEP